MEPARDYAASYGDQRKAASAVLPAKGANSVKQRLALRVSGSGLGNENEDSQPGNITEGVSLFMVNESPLLVRSI
jgi:hypothetical protein